MKKKACYRATREVTAADDIADDDGDKEQIGPSERRGTHDIPPQILRTVFPPDHRREIHLNMM